MHVRQETGACGDGSIYWNLDETPVEQVAPPRVGSDQEVESTLLGSHADFPK